MRTQYLVHLAPEKSLQKSLYSLKDTLLNKNILEKDIEMNLHTTVFGFYSDFDRLGFDSENNLESKIIKIFKKLKYDKSYITIKNVNNYSSKIVLELESPELLSLHNHTADSFKHLIVLKGGVLPSENKDYFLKRYNFCFDKYSPHITLCVVNSVDKAIAYAIPLIGKGFHFDNLLLSKREKGIWKDLYSLQIS